MTLQYADYSLAVTSASGAAPTTQAAHGPAPPKADDPQKDVHVTPKGHVGEPESIEEKVEYRDEEGNLLNEEEVAALQGKVSFSTRYETRTRLVDENGNVVHDGVVEDQDGAPPAKPEAVEPGTGRDAGSPESSTDIEADLSKEKSIEDVEATPEPESDVEKQTGKEEL